MLYDIILKNIVKNYTTQKIENEPKGFQKAGLDKSQVKLLILKHLKFMFKNSDLRVF